MVTWKLHAALPALKELSSRYKLVGLSNGNAWFLEHLVANRIKYDFDAVISVDTFGAFKPHPSVYRGAACILELGLEEIMMVSTNSFDVMGARMCGNRGAFVNREALPTKTHPIKLMSRWWILGSLQKRCREASNSSRQKVKRWEWRNQ